MRAARAIDPGIGTRYVVMGHSQGGQAALFTAAIGPEYAPEFTLLGDGALAPASHIGEQLRAALVTSTPTPTLPFLAYALEAYAAYYPQVALERVLAPQAIEHLPDLRRGSIDDALTSGYWVESAPSRQFLSASDLGPVLKALAENEPGTLRIAAPTLLLQGAGDRRCPQLRPMP